MRRVSPLRSTQVKSYWIQRSPNPIRVSGGANCENLTVLATLCADGSDLDPTFIFQSQGKRQAHLAQRMHHIGYFFLHSWSILLILQQFAFFFWFLMDTLFMLDLKWLNLAKMNKSLFWNYFLMQLIFSNLLMLRVSIRWRMHMRENCVISELGPLSQRKKSLTIWCVLFGMKGCPSIMWNLDLDLLEFNF